MKRDSAKVPGKIYWTILAILVLISGGSIWWAANSAAVSDAAKYSEVRENSPDYSFINPILFINTKKETGGAFKELNSLFSGIIASSTGSGAADSISVYMRDLNTGHWTGVNEDDTYEPSSMLKVGILMADLKLAQSNPQFLNELRPYKHTDSAVQYYKPSRTLPDGSYTVQQLLNAMIVNSDNNAADALYADNQKGFAELYRAMRLPNPPQDPGDFMSAKSYSSIFRTLYNSTYLPWEVSEQTLKLLSQTDFTGGLVAGVPQGTTVAHKFGERSVIYQDGSPTTHELHDCGIVYYPEHPYLLCVMTKGKSFPALEGVISSISKAAYDFEGTHSL